MTTQTDGPDWFHAPGAGVPGPGEAERDAAAAGEPSATATDSAPEDRWDDDLLEDWAPQRRTNRLTAVLAVAVIAACTFTAGALVQRQVGGPSTAATTRGGFTRGQGAGAGGFPSGFPGGGFGGAAGQQSANGGSGATGQQGAGGQQQGGRASGATTGSDAAPAVVGTVKAVQGTDLVVENFAGTQVTVHVPATATVTTPGLSGVAAGMTVSVVGAKGADGAVTATSVVARTA